MVGYRRNFWLILNVINDIFIGTKYSPFRQSQTDTKYMNPLSQCSNIFRIARLENSNVTRQNHTGFRAPSQSQLHCTLHVNGPMEKKIGVVEVVSLSLIIGSFFNYNFKERKRSEQRNVFAI